MFRKLIPSLLGVVLIYLLLAVIVFYGTPFLLQVSGLAKPNALIFFLSRIFIWASLILLYLYAKYFEKQKLLIWTERKYKPLFYILSVIAALIIVSIGSVAIMKIVITLTHKETSNKLLEYVELFRNNTPLLIFTALTAGVVEELIFRGYIQTRLQTIFKSPVLAILVSSFLFGILHSSYGTIFQILYPMFIGIVFSWFYWKYKNIKILILCHFLIDTFALLALIKFH